MAAEVAEISDSIYSPFDNQHEDDSIVTEENELFDKKENDDEASFSSATDSESDDVDSITDDSDSPSEPEAEPENEEALRRQELIDCLLNESEVDARKCYSDTMSTLFEGLQGAFTDKEITRFHTLLNEKIIAAFHESLRELKSSEDELLMKKVYSRENKLLESLEVVLYTFLKRHEKQVNKIVEQLKILAFATEAKYDEAMEIFNELQQNSEEEIRNFHELVTKKLTVWFEEMLEEDCIDPREPAFKLEIQEMFNQKYTEISSYINPIDNCPIQEEIIDLDDEKDLPSTTQPTKTANERNKVCVIL